MQLIQQLKAASTGADRQDMDELVALHTFAGMLGSTYASFDLPSPEWLEPAQAKLSDEITSRRRDYLQKQLREAEATLERLKTRDERKSDVQREVDRIRTALGLGQPNGMTGGATSAAAPSS